MENKKMFRETFFENLISEVHKKDLFCPYSPPKIRNDFKFLVFSFFSFCTFFLKVILWAHNFCLTYLRPHFQNRFPNFFFVLFCSLNSKMSRNMCKWRHKVRKDSILCPWSSNFWNNFFLSIFSDNLSHFFTNLRSHN